MVSKAVRDRVEEVLRRKGILTPEKEILWNSWGNKGAGIRVSLVAPLKGNRTIEEKSVTVGPPSGSERDQANGILGAFFSKG